MFDLPTSLERSCLDSKIFYNNKINLFGYPSQVSGGERDMLLHQTSYFPLSHVIVIHASSCIRSIYACVGLRLEYSCFLVLLRWLLRPAAYIFNFPPNPYFRSCSTQCNPYNPLLQVYIQFTCQKSFFYS